MTQHEKMSREHAELHAAHLRLQAEKERHAEEPTMAMIQERDLCGNSKISVPLLGHDASSSEIQFMVKLVFCTPNTSCSGSGNSSFRSVMVE